MKMMKIRRHDGYYYYYQDFWVKEKNKKKWDFWNWMHAVNPAHVKIMEIREV